ncbi:hypothetical protein GCM10022267_79330 [Lentzea roselyniae]|uniref:Uncharacterized protein n=1 Tax=Lentzea roselyniae TaxID=531940 RepID=A0ABP7C9H0_9PSEU
MSTWESSSALGSSVASSIGATGAGETSVCVFEVASGDIDGAADSVESAFVFWPAAAVVVLAFGAVVPG